MKLQKINHYLHRYLGISLALFLTLLSLTGVGLNHAQDWRLDQITVPWFGKTKTTTGFHVGTDWYFHEHSNVYRNDDALTSACSNLVGVATWTHGTIIACSQRLLLIDLDGDVIETLTQASLPPGRFLALGTQSGRTVLKTLQGHYAFDEGMINWNKLDHAQAQWSQHQPMPTDLLPSRKIALDQLLLQLHNGKVLGSTAGKWFLDLLGIGVLLLVISGLLRWYRLTRKSK